MTAKLGAASGGTKKNHPSKKSEEKYWCGQPTDDEAKREYVVMMGEVLQDRNSE